MENEIKPTPEGDITIPSADIPLQKPKKIVPIIIALIALIVIGGVIYWQYIRAPKEVSHIEKESFDLVTKKLSEIPEDYEILEDPVFSPDGKKVAYLIEKEDKYFVMINDEKSEAYDDILTMRPPKKHIQFSSDSQKLAYMAKKEGEWFVVINDKEGKNYSYDEVSGFTFSPDGESFTYMAKKEGKWFVVINDKEGKFDVISEPIFSPNSRDVVYMATEDNKEFIVVNDKKGATYGKVYWPTFSPDSQKLAYMAKKENQWFIVANDVEGNPYSWISPPNFSSDSKKLVYIAGKGKEIFLVVNSKENKGYFTLSNFAFSPDSQKVAYVALQMEDVTEKPQDFKTFLVINNEKSKVYDWDNAKSVYLYEYPLYFPLEQSPVFSPDGQNIAYRVYDGYQSFLVINDTEKEKYKGIYSIIFSPNSEHLAYIAHKDFVREQKDNGGKSYWQQVIVVDDKESEIYEDIAHDSLQFSPDSKYFAYGAKKGNELWWIVEEVEKWALEEVKEETAEILLEDLKRGENKIGDIIITKIIASLIDKEIVTKNGKVSWNYIEESPGGGSYIVYFNDKEIEKIDYYGEFPSLYFFNNLNREYIILKTVTGWGKWDEYYFYIINDSDLLRITDLDRKKLSVSTVHDNEEDYDLVSYGNNLYIISSYSSWFEAGAYVSKYIEIYSIDKEGEVEDQIKINEDFDYPKEDRSTSLEPEVMSFIEKDKKLYVKVVNIGKGNINKYYLLSDGKLIESSF